MSNHVALQRMTLDPRPAGQLRFEGPSCGSQPAHFRLTRVDTTRSTRISGNHLAKGSGGPDDGRGRRFTLPLDKPTYISAEDLRPLLDRLTTER